MSTPPGPVVTDSSSQLLREVLEGASARIEFETIGNDTFKRPVLARLVEPTLTVDTIPVLDELGGPTPGLRTIGRTPAEAIAENWRDEICKAACSFAWPNTVPPVSESSSMT